MDPETTIPHPVIPADVARDFFEVEFSKRGRFPFDPCGLGNPAGVTAARGVGATGTGIGTRAGSRF